MCFSSCTSAYILHYHSLSFNVSNRLLSKTCRPYITHRSEMVGETKISKDENWFNWKGRVEKRLILERKFDVPFFTIIETLRVFKCFFLNCSSLMTHLVCRHITLMLCALFSRTFFIHWAKRRVSPASQFFDWCTSWRQWSLNLHCIFHDGLKGVELCRWKWCKVIKNKWPWLGVDFRAALAPMVIPSARTRDSVHASAAFFSQRWRFLSEWYMFLSFRRCPWKIVQW